MSSFKEIVTKAVLGKGRKVFTTNHTLTTPNRPTTILGCWVINHNFSGVKKNDKINIEGSYDVNIWYSYDNDSKTEVVKQTNNYLETVNVRKKEATDVTNEDVIIRSLSQPSCTKVDIVDGVIQYKIEKELGIELIGDTKVRISIDEDEDEWDDIIDEDELDTASEQIEKEVKEGTIEEVEDLKEQ